MRGQAAALVSGIRTLAHASLLLARQKETMAKNRLDMREHERRAQEQRAVAVSSSGAAAQSTPRNIRLIIGREYKNRVTQRSFLITSIILLVIVFLAAF